MNANVNGGGCMVVGAFVVGVLTSNSQFQQNRYLRMRFFRGYLPSTLRRPLARGASAPALPIIERQRETLIW